MRISWLEADIIRATRQALAPDGGWDDLFDPAFEPPPPPDGVPAEQWPHIAEHVARAERVSLAIRESGLLTARAAFGDSRHAVEQATLVAAAVQSDQLELDLLDSLLSCEIDELLVYGTFLALLVEYGSSADPDRMLRMYEQFCAAAREKESASPLWRERVAGIRDGLANVYVICGRHAEADDLYRIRHAEARGDLVVALAASRAFLSAGEVGRAVQWLGIGADRARDLDRSAMETKLRQKAQSLRRRMS